MDRYQFLPRRADTKKQFWMLRRDLVTNWSLPVMKHSGFLMEKKVDWIGHFWNTWLKVKNNYFTSSDPHHDMSGGGCQVGVVRVNWNCYLRNLDNSTYHPNS